MKKILPILLIVNLFSFKIAHGQILITDDVEPTFEINENAILELKSVFNNKGILLPRIALSATNLATPFTSHVEGMIIYNTQTAGVGNNRVVPGLYYNDGASWCKFIAEKYTIGDIKHSSKSEDHDGWYILDGRSVASLPTVASANAIALGFLTNIPDSRNRYLKAKSATQNLGVVGGSASIVLTQANLPNVTFNATTTNSGSHTHVYNDRGSTSVGSQEINNNARADDLAVTRTTNNTGAHVHTFSVTTGGSSTPINFEPLHIVANVFVYLGN